MNAAEVFRLRFQSLLARGLGASEIAARVGLAAASEVWGGDRPRARPAWYVWLRDRSGAWQVELVGAGPLGRTAEGDGGATASGAGGDTGGGTAVVGRFTVRHYPSPRAPGFERFSAEERRVAAASLDATGAPRIELASAIPDELFTVGAVDWAVDVESDAAVFAMASLNRLQTRNGRGEVLRDVPGWHLTAPIFSVLAGLHAQIEGRATERIVVSRQPGFEVVEEGGVEHVDAPEAACGEAFLVFPGKEASADAGLRLLHALQDRDAEVVYDVHLERGVHAPHAIAADPRLALPVDRAWFGGEAHVADRVMCSC